MRRTLFIAVLFIGLSAACGQQGDILGTMENLPASRVAGWYKVDLDPDLELIQPFILLSDKMRDLVEPSLLLFNGTFYCWFEIMFYEGVHGENVHRASWIYLATSPDAMHWTLENGGEPVMRPDAEWEGNFVGAPSVIRDGDDFVMYYAGGMGDGIGVAASDDGMHWEKSDSNPAMTPDQEWEGGMIGAPSALKLNGKTHLWYSGGGEGRNPTSFRAGKAIGYARLENEGFVKRDAAGRKSTDGASDVEPVMRAAQTWEAYEASGVSEGRVSSPCVITMETPARTVLQMFYTGGEPGELGAGDASIGYAGSVDFVNWEKAPEGVNPIIQEIFSIYLFGISPHLNYDEWAPSVVYTEERSFMIYSQLDALNWLTHQEKGIALAANPAIQ